MSHPIDEAERRLDAAEVAYREGIRDRLSPDGMAARADEAAELAQALVRAHQEVASRSAESGQDAWVAEYLADLYEQFARAHRGARATDEEP